MRAERLNARNKWNMEEGCLLMDKNGIWIVRALDYDGVNKYNRNARTILVTMAPFRDGRLVRNETIYAYPVSKCYDMLLVNGGKAARCWKRLEEREG